MLKEVRVQEDNNVSLFLWCFGSGLLASRKWLQPQSLPSLSVSFPVSLCSAPPWGHPLGLWGPWALGRPEPPGRVAPDPLHRCVLSVVRSTLSG